MRVQDSGFKDAGATTSIGWVSLLASGLTVDRVQVYRVQGSTLIGFKCLLFIGLGCQFIGLRGNVHSFHRFIYRIWRLKVTGVRV